MLTFPLLPLYLRSHICNLKSPKQVSLHAGAKPDSVVGARNGVPLSFVVATISTCTDTINSIYLKPSQTKIYGDYTSKSKILMYCHNFKTWMRLESQKRELSEKLQR